MVVACRIIVSAPVPFPFLWTLDLRFGTWILDLDFGLGFGTGLGLDNYVILRSVNSQLNVQKCRDVENLEINRYAICEVWMHICQCPVKIMHRQY